MTRLSLRMTNLEYSKLPVHCRLWHEDEQGDEFGRDVPAFYETYPIEEELKVSLHRGWESAAFKLLVGAENQLIRQAKEVQEDAIAVLKEVRKLDNLNTPNLGITVRVRRDMLGPRVNWVRFIGKGNTGSLGRTQYYTKTVPLAGRYRVSKRTFAAFPDEPRKMLIGLEENAAVIRYQVEKLVRLRDLIYEPQYPRKK